MDTTLDTSIRLAALQESRQTFATITHPPTDQIVDRAKEFYAFLTGVGYVSVTLKPAVDPLPPITREAFDAGFDRILAKVAAQDAAVETKDPLPLDGHDLVPTADAVEAAKRKRRTKAEMEAARVADANGARVSGFSAEQAQKLGIGSAVEGKDALTALFDKNTADVAAIAEATAATPAPAVSIASDQVIPEVADVRAALMKVVEKDGLGPTAGSKLLAQFGVKRVSELDAKTFADFIAACNAAVAA